MTRKDYQVIAQAISDARDKYTPENVTVAHIVGVLMSRLKEENPRFDHNKFLKACGL